MSRKPQKSQEVSPHLPVDIPPVDTPVVYLDKGEESRTRSLYGLPPVEDGEVSKGEK